MQRNAPIFSRPYFWLALIVLLGAALRLYQLGADSFWVDEAGVAYAARMRSIPEMLQVVRSHVLAMPLDYLVAWLAAKVSTQEGVLRLPSALWGIASLAAAYPLYRRFVPAIPALLGVLVLALSPLHIQYSQELRFYAALVFFSIVSTALLWDALQRPSLRRWLAFGVVHIIGIYFHPYVLFVLVNGLVWLGLGPKDGQTVRQARTCFLMAATVSLVAFLVGYLTFSASNFFKIPLMVFEASPAAGFAMGLGWLPFSAAFPGLSWVWGLVCAALEVTGIAAVLRREPRGPLAGLFYSLVLQIVLVIGSDLAGHYFFAPRQLLMLLPSLCLFAGVVAWQIIQATARFFGRTGLFPDPVRARAGATALLVFLLVLASAPAIALFFRDDKGDSRGISELILREWHSGDTILVLEGSEGFVYQYYIQYVFNNSAAAERTWVADWEDLDSADQLGGKIFVISPGNLAETRRAQLQAAGLIPRYQSDLTSRYAKTLWVSQ